MKSIKFILLGVFSFFILSIVLAFVYLDEEDIAESKPETMIDATQFSRISSSDLIEIMGEPQSIEGYPWSVPKTRESITGELYIYEDSKYEFILFEDSVVRLNVYSGNYMGYSEESFKLDEDSILQQFGIKPNEHLKKIRDNGLTLRYSPVSDTIADFWIEGIEDDNFDSVKITYNLNYF